MSKRYSDEFKESVIKKMMPPNPTSIQQLCRETGVSDVTLYKWRKSFRNKGLLCQEIKVNLKIGMQEPNYQLLSKQLLSMKWTRTHGSVGRREPVGSL